jgi:membrane-bound metal-dependent hydrolase YbcI (DUF457 family)
VAEADQAPGAAMIAGPFGFAAAVKSREQETPLWALMLASVWLDIVFVPLFLMGLETMQPAEAVRGGYGANIIHADYTHSIVGMILLSILLGAVAGYFWGRRSGIVIGLVSASHWVLDLIVHRADMPILPGNVGGLPRLGFGLWRIPQVSLLVELALVSIGAWLYWRAASRVADEQQRGKRAATISAVLIAVFGVLILWLDFSS